MSEPTITLSDAQAVEYGFAPTSTETVKTETVTKEESATEVKTETATPAPEKLADSVSPIPAEVAPIDGGKTPYTPEEIETELKDHGDLAKLDSSRLTPEGKLLQKSFQRGTTGSFEKSKQMQAEASKKMEEANRKLAEFEQKQKEIENQKIFQKEADEYGEDIAKDRLEKRQMQEDINRLKWEAQQAQRQSAGMQIRNDFRQVAPKYFVPQDQVYEDMVLSRIVAGDMLQMEGTPKTIDESSAIVADALGFTNIENLWKIIKANPANYTAVKNFFINDYNKEKAKGPTISSSSTANIQKPLAKSDPNKTAMDNILDRLGVKDLNEVNLT